MIARRVRRAAAFSRRDAVRLLVFATILAGLVTAILSIDLLPGRQFQATVDQPSPVDVYAPRAVEYTSLIQTAAQQQAARAAVVPQYDYTAAKGQQFATQQVDALQSAIAPIDAAFGAALSAEARQAALAAALPDLSAASRTTLLSLDASAWTALRGQMITTLEQAQAAEVRDTELPTARAALGQRLSPSLPSDQRALATEILTPLLLADSSFDQAATTAAEDAAAAAVQPVIVHVSQGELVVLKGARLSATDVEKLNALGFYAQQADTFRIAGWFVFAALVIGLLLAWVWRFRPGAVASHQHPGPAGPPHRGLDGRVSS